MAGWRGLTALAACALALGACGGGGGATTTTGAATTAITYTLTVDDTGNLLRLRPGDEVIPRLPLTSTDDAGWVLTESPNQAVLAGGDDLRFFPSEIGQGGAAYHEFSFIAVGPGRTTVTLTHGFQKFTFTVQVSDSE